MSNYSKATDFAAKDALLTGNPNKVVQGTEIDDEFNAISTAIASKEDTASTSTAKNTITEATAGTGVTVDGLLIKDSGIPEAAVTAHEAALTVTESQISDLGTYETADATILKEADVDDTPVNGVVTAPISSNWAYDHENAADPHPGYLTPAEGNAAYEAIDAAIVKSDEAETITAAWAFSGKVDFGAEIVESTGTVGSGLTPELDPADGVIQTWTLASGTSVPTEVMADGEYITLLITSGGNTITWTHVDKWVGGATPTLENTAGSADIIELWKVGTTTYGAHVGVSSSA